MKIILTTQDPIQAISLTKRIKDAIEGNNVDINIETWSIVKSAEGFDIVYHNVEQYVNDPDKNVVFKMYYDGSTVVFDSAWWKKNPEPQYEMICLHTGRLTEMLLRYFNRYFIKFSIVN